MQRRRAEVRTDLTGGQPAGEFIGAAAADLSSGSPARQDAVQEYRQAELVPQPIGQDKRLRRGGPGVLIAEIDDRRDIQYADTRVGAGVGAEVDRGHGCRPGVDNGAGEHARGARHRVDAALVIAVAVDIEQSHTRTLRHGLGNPRDRPGVAALRDVGNRQQCGGGQAASRTYFPPSRTARPSTTKVASRTTTSR